MFSGASVWSGADVEVAFADAADEGGPRWLLKDEGGSLLLGVADGHCGGDVNGLYTWQDLLQRHGFTRVEAGVPAAPKAGKLGTLMVTARRGEPTPP